MRGRSYATGYVGRGYARRLSWGSLYGTCEYDGRHLVYFLVLFVYGEFRYRGQGCGRGGRGRVTMCVTWTYQIMRGAMIMRGRAQGRRMDNGGGVYGYQVRVEKGLPLWGDARCVSSFLLSCLPRMDLEGVSSDISLPSYVSEVATPALAVTLWASLLVSLSISCSVVCFPLPSTLLPIFMAHLATKVFFVTSMVSTMLPSTMDRDF